MLSRRFTLAGAIAGCIFVQTAAYAQAGKKAAKPPAKPAAQTPGNKQPIVLGTKQLPGDFGEIGTTYTIGSQEEPFNFTLLGADYSVGRMLIDPTGGDAYHLPKTDEKFLVLRFTVQNPTKRDLRLFPGSFQFTGVSAKNTNHTDAMRLTRPNEEESLDFGLKPAQKVEVVTALVVSAEGEVPKLIVQRGEGPVIRYDLKGKVTPLASPFKDPSDKAGATPANPVQATRDTYYPFTAYDVKLSNVAYVTENPDPDGEAPGDDVRLLQATLTFRGTNRKDRLYSGSLESKVKTADGEEIERDGGFTRSNRKAAFDGTLSPGQEVAIRVTYRIPKDAKLKTLMMNEPEHRPLTFDISNVQ